MKLADVLDDLADTLRNLNQSFALVGGIAVSARGEPRFTRDVDLAVVVNEHTLVELLSLIVARGYHRNQDLLSKWKRLKSELS